MINKGGHTERRGDANGRRGRATMNEYKADQRIGITNDICPMTFVKTKLKLESMSPGEILEVILKGGEPLVNVPRSVKEEGHRILDLRKYDDNYKLLIERR